MMLRKLDAPQWAPFKLPVPRPPRQLDSEGGRLAVTQPPGLRPAAGRVGWGLAASAGPEAAWAQAEA
jgi:hypothetical protein